MKIHLHKKHMNLMINFSGKWESDTDIKATCKKDKVEILEYCKKVQISLSKDTKNKKDKSKKEIDFVK